MFGRIWTVLRWLLRNWRGVLIAVAFWHIGWYMGWFIGQYRDGSPTPKRTTRATPQKRSTVRRNVSRPTPALPSSRAPQPHWMQTGLSLSPSARALADIQTSQVKRTPISQTLHLIGVLRPDASKRKHLLAPSDGTLQETFPERKQFFRKGQMLFTWRPHRSSQPTSRPSSRPTLPQHFFAPFDGWFVPDAHINHTHITEGTSLGHIEQSNAFWLDVHVPLEESQCISLGMCASFTSHHHPGATFRGCLSKLSRRDKQRATWHLRFSLRTKQRTLRSGMVMTGTWELPLDEQGDCHHPTHTWSCPTHKRYTAPTKGRCPHCGRTLTPSTKRVKHPLVIPETAVLTLGEKAHVYTRMTYKQQPYYVTRMVQLGPHLQGQYIVLGGLKVGESVVTNGAYLLDGIGLIRGKPTLTSPKQLHITQLRNNHEGNKTFVQKLQPLYQLYLQLLHAYTQKKWKQARSLYPTMRKVLREIPSKELSGYARNVWHKQSRVLHKHLYTSEFKQTPQQIRISLKQTSERLIHMLYTYGHTFSTPLYVYQCSQKGHTSLKWLQQQSRQTRLPYPLKKPCGRLIRKILPRYKGR
ncbi:MAG: hypothetical protein CL920_11545 [Deltaproteobacteria bacterium]|nr:hypothetical protein [Deltaproteobacteria bacterium]